MNLKLKHFFIIFLILLFAIQVQADAPDVYLPIATNQELPAAVWATGDTSTMDVKFIDGRLHVSDSVHGVKNLRVLESMLINRLKGYNGKEVMLYHVNDAGVKDTSWIVPIQSDGTWTYFYDVEFSEVIIDGFVGTWEVTAYNLSVSDSLNFGQTFNASNVTSLSVNVTDDAIKTHPYDINTTGLVGWWKLDDDYLDSSVNDNDGTAYGDTHFVSIKYENGSRFDGDADFIFCAHNESLNLSMLYFSTFIKYNDSGNWNGILYKPGSYEVVVQNNDNILVGITIDNVFTTYEVNYFDIIDFNNNIFIEVIYDKEYIYIYKNLDLIGSKYAPGNITNSTSSVHVGRRAAGYLNSDLDNMLLYDRILSESERNNLYYDHLQQLQIKTNSNATWSSEWNSTADNPIRVPYADGEFFSLLNFTVPETVVQNGIIIYDYPNTVQFDAIATVGYTEDITKITESAAAGTYTLNITHATNNTGAGYINYTTANSVLLDADSWNAATLTTNNPNATLTTTLPNFNISTGYVAAGTEYYYLVEQDYFYQPPVSITNLTNTTGNFWHNWTWTNPTDADFNHTMIYLNNIFTTNTSSTTAFYNFTVSAHNTSTISTHTVGITGNINTTWVNHTSVIGNNPITISNISASYTINEGDIFYIDAESTDADSDTPTFADNSTVWNVNTSTGIVSWQTADGDDGTYHWYINVSDGYGSVDAHAFNVTVNNTIIAPTLSNQSPSTPYYSFIGQNVTFNATSDQVSNNEFLLDSAHQSWSNGTSPTYINTTAAIGEYNITLIAYNTTNSSLSDQFTWTWNVSVLQPPQNMTNVTDLDQIHYNWDDYESADYWNISQLDVTIPYTSSYPVLDGIEDACYDCCCAYGFVFDEPNPYTTYGRGLSYILRNDTYLILYNTGEDNDGLSQDDEFSVGIDASNNNLTTDDRKFILGEGGTVTAKRWSGSSWLPQATNAQGVVVGAGTPGAIQYEMFIPVSELDTNFTNGSTVKFFMSRTHTGSQPDIESYYPQTLQNDTDATLWQSVLLSETPQYTYINNTTTSDYTVPGLDHFTWYQHKFVTINGTLESSAVNHVAVTLDTPSYSIEGYIKDIFGNFIPNATVYAQNGYVSEVNTSNASGYYSGVHFHNDTYNVYANATGYALNYTTAIVAGANLTNVNVTLTPLQIIPPNPTTLTNFTYNHGVGFNWTVGSGNYTDSYNVSYNGTWYNETTNTFINKTVGAHGTAEIIVYAYNSTENGALSAGYLTDNVTVPNNVPVLTGCPDSNTNEDVPINNAFDLDTYYSDVDGDSPTYSVYSNNQTGNITPSIDGNNVVSYSLAANWNGVAEIVYKVEDGYGANDTDTVIVTVSSVNDPPVLQPIGPQNVNEGQTVTIEVAGTDVETPEVDLDFTCNRTDLFTDFSINGGWTEWITNYSQAGVYHVLFTVSDGTDTDNETVVITVTDIPLTINSYWNNQTGNSLSLSIDTGTTVVFGVTTNRTANTTWYNHSIFAETDTDTTQANYTATFSSAGTFYINASATDGIDQTSNTTFTVEVSVPAVYYNVSGYVFDTNATAISGATVSNNQTAGTNVTNVSGYYVLSLENGSVLITATASGYVSNTTVATVSGDTQNQNITLVALEPVKPYEMLSSTYNLFLLLLGACLILAFPKRGEVTERDTGLNNVLFSFLGTILAVFLAQIIVSGQVVESFAFESQIYDPLQHYFLYLIAVIMLVVFVLNVVYYVRQRMD